MLDKQKNIRPDIDNEMDELQRASQDLSREEGINVSVEKIVDAFQKAEEETLINDIWLRLENTESNEIEKGDFDSVMNIAKKYKKTNPKKLIKSIKNNTYRRPLILNLGDRYILIAGNTRLCTAAAMGVNPKVFIAKIDIDNEINEKWSEKYKKSIDCNNPKGFSQRAHCQGKKKNMKETEILKGGLAKGKTLIDLAKKWDPKGYYEPQQYVEEVIKKKLNQGIKVEMEHTTSSKIAKEIAMDHLWEDIKYYDKLAKMETKEMTGADSSGSYVGPMNIVKMKKKDINKINNWNQLQEALDASASGEYDVPFGGGPKGRKDPLKIGGPKTIEKRINKIKGPDFPKWGGPKSKFVKVKEKCKKFPYCNQGDTGAIKIFNEALEKTSEKYGISPNEVLKIVLNTNR